MSSPPPVRRLAAKRRNKVSLLLQFSLQWLYLPVWGVVAVALGVLVALASAGLNPPLRWFDVRRGALSPHRFHVEWVSDPALWDTYAADRIRSKVEKANANPARYGGRVAPDGNRELTVTVPAVHFRGVGPDRAIAIAQSLGWTAQLKGNGREVWNAGALRLTGTIQSDSP
ncbi:hypothetical protein [Actinomadura sp. HBU206391]|uniref:hypothetical protein n=1 Tax=Actinomadura sp. HBU206391 TaxID=2731692 RepID=UPI00164FA302|nr:hypothetical protein [Actinomadura sp. HBU206391]MBC6460788.1 hypothetical protein [Actinomadura sp. HBU206391]